MFLQVLRCRNIQYLWIQMLKFQFREEKMTNQQQRQESQVVQEVQVEIDEGIEEEGAMPGVSEIQVQPVQIINISIKMNFNERVWLGITTCLEAVPLTINSHQVEIARIVQIHQQQQLIPLMVRKKKQQNVRLESFPIQQIQMY